MEIVFQNGSKITSIDDAGECIRGKVRDFVPVVKLEVGLKIKCRDAVYQNLIQEEYIQDNFKLNVKRLNRWWYSVYFTEKCKHNYPLIDNVFCPKCGEKLQ